MISPRSLTFAVFAVGALGVFIVLITGRSSSRSRSPPPSASSSPAAAVLSTNSSPIVSSDFLQRLGFQTITDGPFTFSGSTWGAALAPVHVRLPPQVNGVVLLFHGCSHDGKDFFRLLEERWIVSHILNRSFAAVAFTSANRRSGCWSGEDVPLVQASFAKLGFDRSLPLLAFGASSGGYFVTKIARDIPVEGVIVEISTGTGSTGETLAVPAAFIYMEKDVRFASATAIGKVKDRLKARGIPSEAYGVKGFTLPARIFVERLPEFFDAAKAKALFEELQQWKFVDSEGTLLEDPRRTAIVDQTMQILVTKGFVKEEAVALVKANIVELYNGAWAYHELTREKVPEAIDFLLANRPKRQKA
jgi:hypothetical protein